MTEQIYTGSSRLPALDGHDRVYGQMILLGSEQLPGARGKESDTPGTYLPYFRTVETVGDDTVTCGAEIGLVMAPTLKRDQAEVLIRQEVPDLKQPGDGLKWSVLQILDKVQREGVQADLRPQPSSIDPSAQIIGNAALDRMEPDPWYANQPGSPIVERYALTVVGSSAEGGQCQTSLTLGSVVVGAHMYGKQEGLDGDTIPAGGKWAPENRWGRPKRAKLKLEKLVTKAHYEVAAPINYLSAFSFH